MERKLVYLIVSVILVVALVFTFLYFRGGLRQYIRARSLVNELSIEKQDSSWKLLYGRTDGNEYGGIYAGITKIPKPKVWVWGKTGLKSFPIDESSIYWHLDGCDRELSPSNPSIPRVNDRTINDWRRNMDVGDYIMVVITTERMGGTRGNLREVVGMDWYPFLQKGLEEECKR